MKSEYQTTTLGELIQQDGGSIKTGPFGTTLKASEYSESGVPVISVGEVGFGEIRLHQRTPHVDRDVTERLPEYVLKSGDIVFGRKGAVERSAWVKDDQDGWFLGSDGIRLRLPNTTNSRFISYSLLTERHRSWMLTNCVGTTMHSLNQGVIERIPIVLPPLPIQNRIADILSAFDEKIELNRQMNRTLEQMARALFKSWFIDFDPVHAKQRGEQPVSMDAETAALFPDRFEQIDGKEVPEGWDYCKASEIAVIKIGKTPPRNEPEWFSQDREDEVWISIRDMGKGGIFISDSSEYLSKESIGRFNINMAPAGSILLSFKLTLGRVKIVTKDSYTNEAIAQFSLPRESYSYYFYFLLSSYDYSALGSTSSIATAVNSKIIKDMPILSPSELIVDAFGAAIESLMSLSRIREEEINHLEQMRDSLLPRLLSGELDVSDWENAVEDPEGAPA